MPQEEKKAPSASEALDFLDKIVGKVAGSRQDHIAIQGAIGIISAALQPSEVPCCDDKSACTDEGCEDKK